jgi:putative PIN family toxin of toxin-antitoxin system
LRVFLDTNVLVAAFATRGLCADLLREVLARFDLVLSEEVLQELAEVLPRKAGLDQRLTRDIVAFVREQASLASPGDALELPLSDPEDVVIVSAAVRGNATVFVTGDRELLALGRVGEPTIVSPRSFWERMGT